jgi:hypothetical protein
MNCPYLCYLGQVKYDLPTPINITDVIHDPPARLDIYIYSLETW